MSIISVITDPGVGGTFLDWTLHYLAGHKTTFCAADAEWKELISNPLNGSNSHSYRPNQIYSINELNFTFSQFASNPTDTFHSLYFHNFLIHESYHEDNVTAVDIAMKHSHQAIVLTLNQNHLLYYSNFEKNRSLSNKLTDPSKKNQSYEEQLQDFVDFFLKESDIKWKDLKLVNRWDQREFLALNLRPLNTVNIKPNVDLTKPHYLLEPFELFTLFDQTVNNLFDYLNINIDQSRLYHWNQIYQIWKKNHTGRINFVLYFDSIIESILNNYDLDLTRFNLDIIQEASIQHHLIYNHNLNLKTWQLEKFNNTRQLHNLLESNIHALKTY